MKNNKALAIALSAGLVLGGTFVADTANVAYAAAEDLGQLKTQAEQIVDSNVEANNINEAQANTFKSRINSANSKEEINSILNEIATKYRNDQAAANELAAAKTAAKEIVDNNVAANNINAAQAKTYKNRIDSANSKEEINSILNEIATKYRNDQAAANELAAAKETAKAIVDNNVEANNITPAQGNTYKNRIDSANSKEEINEILKEIHDKYVADQLADKTLSEAKAAGKQIVDNNVEANNITPAQGNTFKNRIDSANSKEEINEILKEIYDIYKNNISDNSTPLIPIEDAEEIEEVTLKGTFHFPEGAQDATFKDENGSAAYGQLRDYAYKFEAKYGEPSIVRNDDDTYDIYYDNYVAPVEEVTLKGTFHFPGSNGQDATFTGVDGKDAYAKLRDYAYSFEKEFGEPSIMKNDDDTYDIYYDLYKKPEEKEDFTITVKVFKPYQGEDNYYASATFSSDRYDGDYDKAMADVWNWADAQSGSRKYRAEIVSKYEIHIHELEESKTSIPWTDLTPAKPIKKPSNDWVFPFPLPFPIEGAEIVVPAPEKPAPDNIAPIGPGPVIPTPVTPAPEKPVEEDDDKTENIDVDSIIKDIDERNKEILDEMAKIDTTITDENKKPADEDKKPVDEDKKPSDDEKQPSKEKEVVVKEVVKVPAKAHSNPKTGVAGISAVAGTLAISMAGIVATRKKND